MSEEQKRLESIANDSWYAFGVNANTIRHSGLIFDRYIKDGPILELGPAEGIMTEYFAAKYKDITVVDGSASFCSELRKKFPQIRVEHSLFEDFMPDKKYESIILGHVLEHVMAPAQILKRIKNWLSPTGRIYAAVPNSHSIHRQAAVIMGLLQREDELNQTDIHHGHRRVYNSASLAADFYEAGLVIEISGGYWLKPVSNVQIEQTWTQEMIAAFMILGERYPDIAAELYVVAKQ